MTALDFSDASVAIMLAAWGPYVDKIGAHTGDPGISGTANECTGGSPAYAKVPCPGFATPSGRNMSMTSTVTFNILNQTVSYLSFWAAGGAYLGRGQLPISRTVVGQGTVVITNVRPTLP